MPNWFYLASNFLYLIGLAIWIGGSMALGALVAPSLFKALPRPQAGSIFGPILRRFARWRVVALVLIIAGAAMKYLGWEAHAATVWIALRWAAIAFLAFSVVYEVGYLERALEKRRLELNPDFSRLHRRAEVLMKSSLIAAVVALFLS